MSSDKRCFQCGALWEESRTPGHQENCSCGASWYCCANCRFADLTMQNWCSEPQARYEKPLAYDKGNNCSWFMPGDNFSVMQEQKDRARRAKEALLALGNNS